MMDALDCLDYGNKDDIRFPKSIDPCLDDSFDASSPLAFGAIMGPASGYQDAPDWSPAFPARFICPLVDIVLELKEPGCTVRVYIVGH